MLPLTVVTMGIHDPHVGSFVRVQCNVASVIDSTSTVHGVKAYITDYIIAASVGNAVPVIVNNLVPSK